jgi:hypothetical protein
MPFIASHAKEFQHPIYQESGPDERFKESQEPGQEACGSGEVIHQGTEEA